MANRKRKAARDQVAPAELKTASSKAPDKPTDAVSIVNPAGAVHGVTADQARELMNRVGYRKATGEEIEQLKAQNGKQVCDKPIAATWAQEVVAMVEQPEE